MTAHSVAFRPRGDIDSASPVSRLLTPFEMAKGSMVVDRLNFTLGAPLQILASPSTQIQPQNSG